MEELWAIGKVAIFCFTLNRLAAILLTVFYLPTESSDTLSVCLHPGQAMGPPEAPSQPALHLLVCAVGFTAPWGKHCAHSASQHLTASSLITTLFVK